LAKINVSEILMNVLKVTSAIVPIKEEKFRHKTKPFRGDLIHRSSKEKNACASKVLCLPLLRR